MADLVLLFVCFFVVVDAASAAAVFVIVAVVWLTGWLAVLLFLLCFNVVVVVFFLLFFSGYCFYVCVRPSLFFPLNSPFCSSYLLVGLVVKASASRAGDPGFESRLGRDFFGVESYQ